MNEWITSEMVTPQWTTNWSISYFNYFSTQHKGKIRRFDYWDTVHKNYTVMHGKKITRSIETPVVLTQLSGKCLSTISRMTACCVCNMSEAKLRMTYSMLACVANAVLLCSGNGYTTIWLYRSSERSRARTMLTNVLLIATRLNQQTTSAFILTLWVSQGHLSCKRLKQMVKFYKWLTFFSV